MMGGYSSDINQLYSDMDIFDEKIQEDKQTQRIFNYAVCDGAITIEVVSYRENEESDLLDIEDMEVCPMCGQNYISEDQAMCDECSGKGKSKNSENGNKWKDDEDDESLTDSSDDVDGDEEDDEKYNSGFSDIDVTDEDDPFKTDDDIVDDEPILFASEEDELEESFDEETTSLDDFETVDVSDVDDEEDDEEDDDDDYGDDDMLGKKR
jgi:hypothetical protein